jgi:predicted RND superfamily exporter protein
MKISKIYLLLIASIALTSCSHMNFDVAKRKYRSGYYVDMSSYKKEKSQITSANKQSFTKELNKAETMIPASVNSLERKLLVLNDDKKDLSLVTIPEKINAPTSVANPIILNNNPSASVIENFYSQQKNIASDESKIRRHGDGDYRFMMFLILLLLLIVIVVLLFTLFNVSLLLAFLIFILLLFIIFHFLSHHHQGGRGY